MCINNNYDCGRDCNGKCDLGHRRLVNEFIEKYGNIVGPVNLNSIDDTRCGNDETIEGVFQSFHDKSNTDEFKNVEKTIECFRDYKSMDNAEMITKAYDYFRLTPIPPKIRTNINNNNDASSKFHDYIIKEKNEYILSSIKQNHRTMKWYEKIKMYFIDIILNIFMKSCFINTMNGCPYFMRDYKYFKQS